jgi:hypothetical protein
MCIYLLSMLHSLVSPQIYPVYVVWLQCPAAWLKSLLYGTLLLVLDGENLSVNDQPMQHGN